MADEEAVKAETVAAEDAAPPKSKEEMRDVPHSYVDANHNNDWCAVCGRGEGWRAHGVKEEETPAVPPDVVTIPAAPSTVATTAPLDAGNAGIVLKDEAIEIDAAPPEKKRTPKAEK